jgi:glycosyl transferase family 2/methyltransferase family protein
METGRLTSNPEIFACIGEPDRKTPGWLTLHGSDDADIPFRPGDDFPFEDRAVDVLACGDFVAGLSSDARVGFFLECRRVLKPGGLLSLRVASPNGNGSGASRCMPEILHSAALAGLAAADGAPVGDGCRRALQEQYSSKDPMPTLEYTKRDRGVGGNPLVSIAIPAYSPRFFAACLDSALAQTYPTLEIVVCDDSGGTEIEAMTCARAHRGNVRYLRNEVRLGPRANFAKCLENSNGEFLKFLCDDDLLAPTCVASLLNAFRLVPDLTLATSHRRRIDEKGNLLDDQPATIPIVASNTTIAGYTLANAMVMAGLNMVGEPTTALFRKSDLLDHAPDYFQFNGEHGHGIIDMVMWSSLLMKGDAVYLTESLSAFRIHPMQRQRDPTTAQRTIAGIRALQAAWLELGLFERVPPHLMLARPFPPHADSDWHLQPVLSPYAVRRVEHAGQCARAGA